MWFDFPTIPISIFALTMCASDVGESLPNACERQDWDLVLELLDSGADVNVPQPDGMTALMWAAYYEKPHVVEDLLAHGADADQTNDYSVNALLIAARNGAPRIVSELLKANADPNVSRNGGATPLMLASRAGRVKVVDELLKAGANANETERSGQTALMWAAAEGHLPVVRRLLKAKADPSIGLKSGFDAFFLSVRAGHSDVAFELLQHGHDVNDVMKTERPGGKMPRRNMSALMLAIENAHFELAARLLEAGADPNDLRSGTSPLHILTFVRKPNKGDGANDDPPPQSTGPISSLEMAEILVQHGADVNLRLPSGGGGRGKLRRKGATPFLLAADTADLPYLKQLLNLGADPTIPNVEDCPPLLAAAGIGSTAPEEEAGSEPEILKVLELLLSLGADVNHVDANGETAMHGAAYKNVPKVVHLLDKAGADPAIWNRRNKYGWTPLLLARGFRPGNFKPDAATEAAVIEVMERHGLKIPPKPSKPKNNDAYAKKKNPGK